MTGHLGERTNYAVALQTDDFRVYHELAPYFERHSIRLVGVAPHETPPDSARVILGGRGDDPRSIPLLPDKEANLIAVRAALDPRPTAQGGRAGGYRRVTLGIDPGLTIGLAIVADDWPLLVAEAFGPLEAVQRLQAWCQAVTADHFTVHVGDGDPERGAPIMAVLKQLLSDVPAFFVPEQSTSPPTAITGSRHSDAAIVIALRRPG